MNLSWHLACIISQQVGVRCQCNKKSRLYDKLTQLGVLNSSYNKYIIRETLSSLFLNEIPTYWVVPITSLFFFFLVVIPCIFKLIYEVACPQQIGAISGRTSGNLGAL